MPSSATTFHVHPSSRAAAFSKTPTTSPISPTTCCRICRCKIDGTETTRVGLCKRRRKPRGFTLFLTRVCGGLLLLLRPLSPLLPLLCRNLGFGREASEKGSAVGEGMAGNLDLLTITGVGCKNLSKLVEKGIAGVAASYNSTKTRYYVILTCSMGLCDLEICADSLVGDEMRTCIFGGQKKQLTIVMGDVKGRKHETGRSGITSITTNEDCEEEYTEYANGGGRTLAITRKVPINPLQRPDEMMQIDSNSATQYSIRNDYPGTGIATMITWSFGGKQVAIEGSWQNWRARNSDYSEFLMLYHVGEMLVGPGRALLMDEISTDLDSSTTFQIANSN
ncbi:hypothetical protein RHMOL_Rhmol06G0153800 [Rhododendron molle]|uniref:Uncharacterized protein n=1 Tax=Rhododendron molle TaxID=49168 RepID=A0ACC0ND81_RHOML|nr:hypothetical protein RHMOL_Rhmol06G0153800 [Rhododendron molle]